MPANRGTPRTAEPIRRVLERALGERGLSRRLERRLPQHAWREAVGPGIAARAMPTVLSGGVLHVLVEDHRWRDQLDAARVTLIERVNARLGRPLVRELRFGLAHAGTFAPAASGGPPLGEDARFGAEGPCGVRAEVAAPGKAAPGDIAPAEVAFARGLHPELRAAFNAAARAASRARARSG